MSAVAVCICVRQAENLPQVIDVGSTEGDGAVQNQNLVEEDVAELAGDVSAADQESEIEHSPGCEAQVTPRLVLDSSVDGCSRDSDGSYAMLVEVITKTVCSRCPF